MVRIKVCGIASKKDAFLAVDLGVDALGFIFAKSPRSISPLEAKRIIKSLPPFVDRVGVFVNEVPSRVEDISRFCQLTTLQFHGDESPSYCSLFFLKIIKSFPVRDRVPHNILSYKVDAFLLDTFCRDVRGGSGKVFNWDIAVEVKNFGFPLILSGGLSPDNIEEAIRKVKPFAVDVASGVEEKPGKKSKSRLKEFVRKVRENDEAIQVTG